jgi:hypothetical protein
MRYDHADNNIVANRLFMDQESINLGVAQMTPTQPTASCTRMR